MVRYWREILIDLHKGGAALTDSIGIVGCGAIGQAILKESDAGRLPVPIAGVTSRTESTARAFLCTLASPPPYVDLPELISLSSLVVEDQGGTSLH